MGTVPTGPTFTAGEKPTAAKLNTIKTYLDFLANPPQCYAYVVAPPSPATGVWTAIPFDGELFDIVQSGDSGMHDLVTNNSRIIFRTAGKYLIAASVFFASNATGLRELQIRSNAAGNVASGTGLCEDNRTAVNGVASTCYTSTTFTANAGDYIEAFALQSSGAALALTAGSALTFMTAKWIST